MSDHERSIAAWAQTLDAVVALADDFADTDWQALTECPGWTVKDVYAHLVGGEVWMSQGHPRPETGLARISDEPVAARREATGASVLTELRDVFELRRRQLAEDPPDPEAPTFTAYLQPVTVGILLRMRAFDAWVHEQDIRRAVDRPGNLATAGAGITRDVFLLGLGRVVAKAAGAPPGSSVTFAVSGALPFERSILVDENGRGVAGTVTDPTTRIATDWETFSRLAAGRIPVAGAAVEVTGDRELADRILAHFAVTP